MSGITDPAQEYFKDGLWAWVADQWKKLVADASNFLQINIAAQDIDVEIKQQTAADLTPGGMGWDGSAWHKLAMLWGYSDRWEEKENYTMLSDTYYNLDTTAVPAGYVYKLEMVSIYNNTGARGSVHISVLSGGISYHLVWGSTPARYVPTIWAEGFTMKEGDVIRVRQLACLTNDVIRVIVRGYKMKVAE